MTPEEITKKVEYLTKENRKNKNIIKARATEWAKNNPEKRRAIVQKSAIKRRHVKREKDRVYMLLNPNKSRMSVQR